jgi:hypothetical protein
MRKRGLARRIASFPQSHRNGGNMSRIKIPRLIVAALVLSAIVVPAANAQPIDPPGIAQPAPAGVERATPVAPPPAESPEAIDSSGGFDWGDAALGAAGMLALGTAGAGVVTMRRGRNPLPTG